MTRWIFIMWCATISVVCSSAASAQSVRSLINSGNDLYHEDKFADAEVDYRKAVEKEHGLVEGYFNLGDALYKQGKFADASREFEAASLKALDKGTKAKAYHNLGNAQLREGKYREAIGSYIEALKLRPSDEETKYNLSYALQRLKEQQQQQNKNESGGENDQNDNQQNNDQQNQQKGEQRDQEQKQAPQQQELQAEQNQRPQDAKKMSQADAERILDVLKNNERDVQKKLRVRQGVRVKTDKDW